MPHDATAVVTPAACMAMTSVYPSTITARCPSAIDFFAWSRPNSTFDFLYSIVSGVFMYLPRLSSSKSLRAPKPMTSPLMLRIGHSNLRWKRSIGPFRPIRASPALSSSSNVNPSRCRCLVSVSHPAGAYPQPKCLACSMVKPRSVRNVRAVSASGLPSCMA